MFTNQPNIFHSSGVYPTLLTTCHHQIIYAKICFKVHFPPPFERVIWHCNRASADLIKISIEQFYWTKSVSNLGLSEKVELFNEALLNIFSNFIPHEPIKVKSKDPRWMNKEIKCALRKKNKLCRKYISVGRTDLDEANLIEATNFVSDLITTSKESYLTNIGEKLKDPNTNSTRSRAGLKNHTGQINMQTVLRMKN